MVKLGRETAPWPSSSLCWAATCAWTASQAPQTRLSVCLCIYAPVNLCVCVSMCLRICVSVHLCVCPSVHLCVCVSVHLCVHASVCLCICVHCVCVCLFTYVSVRLCICVSGCLCVSASVRQADWPRARKGLPRKEERVCVGVSSRDGLCALHPSTDHTRQLIQRKVSLPEQRRFVSLWPVLPDKAPQV